MNTDNQKKLVTEDWCWQVFYDEQNQLLEATWLEQAKLEHQEFKAYLEEWCALVEKYTPKCFFVDSRKGHVIMTPEVQTWHDNEIVPRYINAGVRKIAFILPEDIFEAISIEQAFEEGNANQKLKTRFFDKTTDAKNWLCN